MDRVKLENLWHIVDDDGIFRTVRCCLNSDLNTEFSAALVAGSRIITSE